MDQTSGSVLENGEDHEEKAGDCIDQSDDDEDDLSDEERLKLESDLDPDEVERRRTAAASYKKTANELYSQGEYSEARSLYTNALKECPARFKEDRAVFYGNRAACYSKEGKIDKAINDCTEALERNSVYLKVLKRRAALYEEDDKLDSSLEDYKKILELDRTDKTAMEAVQRLAPLVHERNEKLKEEMLGSLKNIGNKILAPFGLSTENFQLQQDPNSGGYTVQFKK